ncbi:C40 family peptidase [Jiella pacifica]|uniref:Peptidoglycan endopeptidase n=1 Tax=Jiella pacifica TaxID=2696469 RepID=A0A6N9T552_9HYPH|nr:NlpC/P60 family protein [Jiella pacifica]NDW04078.1 peptidoglycan endopeptidase [Jiella pacifica]
MGSRFDSLVGLPWLERGRSRDGCDCWGLVLIAFRELLGVDLPSFADSYQTTADRLAIADILSGAREPWIAISPADARPMDVVEMRERPWHVGLVIGRGQMLHMPAQKTALIEPFTTGRHAPRVTGIFRHVSQVAS